MKPNIFDLLAVAGLLCYASWLVSVFMRVDFLDSLLVTVVGAAGLAASYFMDGAT